MSSERELDEAWMVDLARREEAGRVHRAEMAERSIARSKVNVEWLACDKCGATTRHDDGLCYRDLRHPRADRQRGGFQHTPETPTFLERKYGVRA